MQKCIGAVVHWCSLCNFKSAGPSETVEFKNKDKSCATGAVVCYISVFALCLFKCRKVVQMCIKMWCSYVIVIVHKSFKCK